MDSLYERRLLALSARVRAIKEWDESDGPDSEREELKAISRRLNEVADLLERRSSARFALEAKHDERRQPLRGARVDGWPETLSPEVEGPSVRTLRRDLRDLAQSALAAAADLPGPKKRRALRFAALGLLHIRYEHGFDRPIFSNGSVEVAELARVCEAAGMFRSPESLRNALSEAFREFDPSFQPPGIDWLMRQ